MKRLGLGLLTSALAAAAFASLAHAADLPVAPIAPAPAPYYRPAIYNWTGFYIGGHVGGGLAQDKYNQIPGAFLTTPSSAVNVSPTGVIGGAQVGFNYQIAQWVLGVEGSWTDTWLGASGTTFSTTTGLGFTTVSRDTSNILWVAAATARVGYAFDTLLLYVKGGGAWTKVKYTEDVLVPTIVGPTQTMNDSRTGYTVGAGMEYAFTENFSGKLEYDFYDFGTKNYAFAITPVSIKSDVHVFEAGLNYRFTWGP
jgi:outer membrane immunogenic protein